MTESTPQGSTTSLQQTELGDAIKSAAWNNQPVDPYHVLKDRYLDLVESTLAGTIYEDAPLNASGTATYDPTIREYGWDWPSKAFTMIGLKRLRNLRSVIESVIGINVPGDIMETGAWRGGAGIMARAVLAAYGIGDRRVILADSFSGLPAPNPETYPADVGSTFHEYAELAVPLDQVKRNFAKFGLLDEQVVFLPGLFKDTLPTAPVERLAVLRLDGDMYESTIQALDNLYDMVSINGWIVIDDYELVPACRAAVQDFLGSRGLTPEFYPIDGIGVFFRKTECRDTFADRIALQTYERARAARAAESPAGASTPVNADVVAWRGALIAVTRASDTAARANEAARAAKQETAHLRHHLEASEQGAAHLRHHLEALEQEAAHLRHHWEASEQEAAHLHHHLEALEQEAARLRHHLEVIYASRSWRLSSPYRAIGTALKHLHGLGRTETPTADIPPAAEPRAKQDPWSRWPIWLDDNTFMTKRFSYNISTQQFDLATNNGAVALLKDRKFLDIYRGLLQDLKPQRILEIGFFQGGMPLFLADMLAPEKVVGIDYLQPSDALRAIIASARLQDTIKLHGGVPQDDTQTLRKIVETEFADQPLDLIIDDASHEYENSKGCFQELFGFLRPGGKYVIEDWGWLHWPGEEWQTAKSHFWGKPAMTNLIFELVMTLGSQHPKIIARLDVLSWACVVVTRGEGLELGERIDLSETRLTSGRKYQPF
jgi:O-methyltransferase